jgi:hypothetical protein
MMMMMMIAEIISQTINQFAFVMDTVLCGMNWEHGVNVNIVMCVILGSQ